MRRLFSILLLASAIAWMPFEGAAAAASPDGGAALAITALGVAGQRVTPNTIASFSFSLRNPTANAIDFSWSLAIDPEWQPLGPVEGSSRLSGGGELIVPVLASVPRGASPGPGSIGLKIVDAAGAALLQKEAEYVVEASGKLALTSTGAARPSSLGDYTDRFWLANHSNVPLDVELEAQSSMGWPVELPGGPARLPAGGGRWVEIAVRPPKVRPVRVDHTVTLRARARDLPAGRGEAVARQTATVISEAEAWGQAVLKGWVEIESVLTEQDGGVALNAALSGPLDEHRTLDLRLGARLPVGSEDVLTRRASYVNVEDRRYGGLLVGRTSHVFSRMTAYPQWGDWARVLGHVGPADISLFSSVSDPDTVIGRVRGGSVTFGDLDRSGYGLVAFEAERSPDRSGTGFQMAAFRSRYEWDSAHLEGEVALGRVGGSGEREVGFRVAGAGTRGRWDWTSEIQSASERFPGTSSNLGQAWGSFGYAVSRDLRLWAGGMKQLSPDLELPPAVDVEQIEAGVSWRHFDWAALGISHSRTHFPETSSQLERRVDNLTRLRVDLDLGDALTANLVVDIGEQVEGGRKDTVTRPAYRFNYRPNERWLLRGEFVPELQVQEIFDFRQRWSFLARWRSEGGTWIDASGQQLDCGPLADLRCSDEPALRMSFGGRLGSARSNWQMVGFAHRRGDSDFVAGVRMRRDVVLRSPFGRSRGVVLGRILVPEGVPVPAGATVSVGGKTARVDTRGRFRVVGLTPGDYSLSLDKSALGVSLVAVPESSVSVREAGEPTEASLHLHRAGSIEGSVVARVAAAAGGGSDGETRPIGALSVHLEHQRWPQLWHVGVTNSDGSFTVSGLTPGRWRVWLSPHEVPKGFALPGEAEKGIMVQLSGGEVVAMDPIVLSRRERPRALRTAPTLVFDGGFQRAGADPGRD